MEMSFLNMVFSFVPNPVDPTRVIIGMKFRAWKLCIKFYGFNKLSGDIEVFTVVFMAGLSITRAKPVLPSKVGKTWVLLGLTGLNLGKTWQTGSKPGKIG